MKLVFVYTWKWLFACSNNFAHITWAFKHSVNALYSWTIEVYSMHRNYSHYLNETGRPLSASCKSLDSHFLGSISRLCYSIFFSWWMKRGLCRFCSEFLPVSLATNFIPQFLQTHLIHFVSFHFINPCWGATGVVGRHPCHLLIFNIGTSSHLILRSVVNELIRFVVVVVVVEFYDPL